MISLKLSFFATLIKIFGQEICIDIKEPINIYELLHLFTSISGEDAFQYFIEPNYDLKDEFKIIFNGRDIMGEQGLYTIIEDSAEISFFPKLGGG